MSAQQQSPTPRWVRPSQWIRLTGMSRGSTYRAIWSGDLKAVRVGGALFINASELDDYFARNGQPAA